MILFVKLLPKIMRVDLDKEARRLEIERRGQFPERLLVSTVSPIRMCSTVT